MRDNLERSDGALDNDSSSSLIIIRVPFVLALSSFNGSSSSLSSNRRFLLDGLSVSEESDLSLFASSVKKCIKIYISIDLLKRSEIDQLSFISICYWPFLSSMFLSISISESEESSNILTRFLVLLKPSEILNYSVYYYLKMNRLNDKNTFIGKFVIKVYTSLLVGITEGEKMFYSYALLK